MQTPTLAILVEREKKIKAFKPRTYFEVFGDFGVQAGSYRGRWLDENFRKGADEDARAERLWEREKAEAIRDKCLGKTGRRHRGKEAASPGAAPALRPDQPAARRQRTFRLQRAAHAPGRPAALREAQGR